MQKIDIEINDVELAHLQALSRLNNSTVEDEAAKMISKKLQESVDKALEEVLFDKPVIKYDA